MTKTQEINDRPQKLNVKEFSKLLVVARIQSSATLKKLPNAKF